MTEQESKDALYALAKDFIEKQKITCSETVYQTDRVIESAYQFIDNICEIVGFYEYEDDEE